ncbi:hypothetical protein C475_13602 [Halosimplex carlsbadense 2-9-1]|uniref:Uncharacterized protein n=1 Tax=Halosimplex carlsbadense 2-9-1 TaxID=797114 RepID=M0CNR7_9EURY|nr:hypothetical protein [Halosimplex carlsbadense]ELZ24288.1 hypothetical protein C475_13602 [Halosimplex carlsbadense 2-9-1]
METRVRVEVSVALLVFLAAVSGCQSGIDAEQRALDAEERYLSAEFENASCVESWGTSSPIVEAESSVVNRTDGGVYVEVRHPYFYGTNSTEEDGASEAVYRVTAENETRVSGDSVVPC